MSGRWVAGVATPDLLRRYCRLYVGQERPDGRMEVLMEDGTFFTTEPEVVAPEASGLLLPHAALMAIREALEEWQGLRGHRATEVMVLREWLKAEQARVDQLIRPLIGLGS